MNIDAIAQQIKALCPLFNGNVAGAAQYANSVATEVWLPLPAAYVIPLEQEAGDNPSNNGLDQTVNELFGVIVVLDTTKVGPNPVDFADRRGQAAAAYLDTVRAALFRAVLNWRPDFDPNVGTSSTAMSRGIYYRSGSFPEDGAFDRARFFYQFVFGMEVFITDADGWQQPSEPLIDVRGTITSPTTGTPLAEIDAPLDAI